APSPGEVRKVVEALRAEGGGRIVFKGLNYRVVTSESAQPGHRAVEYEVVDPDDAMVLLKDMATEVRAPPAVKAALDQASRLVVSRPPAGAPGLRLALWREARRGGGSAPSAPKPSGHPGPAPAPPKPAPAERPGKKVVSIEWTDVERWCSEHSRFHGTTVGFGRDEDLDVTAQEQAGAAHSIRVKVSGNAFTGA